MSTTVDRRADRSAVAVSPVSFPRVVRSEWIKLWSLRSTYWVIGATLVAMVAMSLLMTVAVNAVAEEPELAGLGPEPITVLSLSYAMGQLVVAVLGVLVITGEYSTGMIRSSFAAVPTRVPVLAAKALVIAVVAFVLGVAGVGLSYVITAPMLADAGGAADLADPDTQRMFWGTGLYLMAVALFSLGVGALLRHSAGAIATVLGIFLVLPSVAQIVGSSVDWVYDALPYLPSAAGERILAVTGTATEDMGATNLLEPWTGYGVLAAYVVVLLLAATVLMRRRDA
ncbi:ABC transporter permease subunit [Georgenia faecalis]|uniref:ABC transporter permease subunit n=1 Tax=Georgenia faecalis TaxID=2483799 RepID=A0ABV9D6R9_9MICO|nr:ABC transporter permease subunit [Georgenia faecalis]